MKGKVSIVIPFLLAFAFSCTQDAALKSNGSATVIGRVNESGGDHILTANETNLKAGFSEYFGLKSVDKMRIFTNEKKLDVLIGHGQLQNGNYLTFGVVLSRVHGDVAIGGGCTQSCTSKSCCSGCTLNLDSDCSGNCTCNTVVPFCNTSNEASCTHTVTTGGGSRVSGDRSTLLKTLAKFNI